MISNSCVDPSARRRGLSNLLQKNSPQKKSTIRSTSINDPHGTKKKMKNEKNLSERKKRTKTKKKRPEQLNTNNNNATITDHSLTSFTSDNDFILPQIGYSSQTDTDYSKYIRGPKHQIFSRQPNGYNQLRQKSFIHSEQTF